MQRKLSSRERMINSIECREPDYVPLSFMIFSALRRKCKDQYEFVEKQLELGLDAFVELPMSPPKTQSEHTDLHGLPMRFDPDVQIREWKEEKAGEKDPLLYKEYKTPSGNLKTVVRKAEDWQHGDHVPLFDDYLIPRSKEFLIKSKADLKPLKHLLTSPYRDDVAEFRESSQRAKEFANKHGLLVIGGWGACIDAACWLCGMEELVLASVYDPDFVGELVEIIAKWNQDRMKVFLDVGIDLYIRRGWYEGADFWAPDLFRRFILPSLKKEVQMAHEAGAKFGYILTAGSMFLLDIILESGVDVLIGVDPVQDRSMNLQELKNKVKGKISLWGGVNGFVTVEMGTREEIENAVKTAMDTLGPDGFILSPVDNIRETTQEVWENVEFMINVWKNLK